VLLRRYVAGTAHRAGSARQALDLGADYLVCQGIEAGGHVQAHRPLLEALSEVLELGLNKFSELAPSLGIAVNDNGFCQRGQQFLNTYAAEILPPAPNALANDNL